MTERDAAIERVLDVIAPKVGVHDLSTGWTMAMKLAYIKGSDDRIPIFEWGHETTPTDEEMRELAEKLVDAVIGEPCKS